MTTATDCRLREGDERPCSGGSPEESRGELSARYFPYRLLLLPPIQVALGCGWGTVVQWLVCLSGYSLRVLGWSGSSRSLVQEPLPVLIIPYRPQHSFGDSERIAVLDSLACCPSLTPLTPHSPLPASLEGAIITMFQRTVPYTAVELRQMDDEDDAVAHATRTDTESFSVPDSATIVKLRSIATIYIIATFFIELLCLPLRFSWLLESPLTLVYLLICLLDIVMTFLGLSGSWLSKQQRPPTTTTTIFTHNSSNTPQAPSRINNDDAADQDDAAAPNNGDGDDDDDDESEPRFAALGQWCETYAGVIILCVYLLVSLLYLAVWTAIVAFHVTFRRLGPWLTNSTEIQSELALQLLILVAMHAFGAWLRLMAIRTGIELLRALLRPLSHSPSSPSSSAASLVTLALPISKNKLH